MECDVCGGTDLFKTGELRKGIFKGVLVFDVYKCQSCGSEIALLAQILDEEVNHVATN